MDDGFPWSLIEAALLADTRSGIDVPCVFRDASMLGLLTESPAISHKEYRRGIDRRSLRRIRALWVREFVTAVVMISGRQIGALGTIVPTGRTFSTLAHVIVKLEGAVVRGLAVEWGLVRELTARGVQILRESEVQLVVNTAAERADLLEGDASATYWARAWRLPPRLSRLAVLLMAGLSPRAIGERSGLSLRSVRTYTEELFALAGVHSRSELAPAALRDGAAPDSSASRTRSSSS